MPVAKKNQLHLKPTYELILVRLFIALGSAVSVVGISLYFIGLGLTDSQVGLFTGMATLTSAVMFLFLPPFLERFNQLKLLVINACFGGLAFALFGFTANVVLAIALFLITHFTAGIIENSKSILYKDSSRNRQEFIKDTGLSGTLGNLGWFFGPLLGGLMLSYAGFKGLFLLAGSLFGLAALYVSIFPFKTVIKKRQKLDTSLRENIHFYLSKPMLKVAYIQRAGVSVWWGFVWTFVPILMVRGGYSVESIGFFIGATAVPLFLEFKTVDAVKKFGYRNIFSWSFGLLTVLCIFAFITPNLSMALAAILLGSISLSFLEPVAELFLYEQVSLAEEEKVYPIYGTAFSAGKITALIGVGVSLALFADKGAYLFIGFLMFFASFKALGIRADN